MNSGVVTKSNFSRVIIKDLTPVFEHHFNGTHGSFRGRPYRRGKNRCWIYGAPKSARSVEMGDFKSMLPRVFSGAHGS